MALVFLHFRPVEKVPLHSEVYAGIFGIFSVSGHCELQSKHNHPSNMASSPTVGSSRKDKKDESFFDKLGGTLARKKKGKDGSYFNRYRIFFPNVHENLVL